MQLVYFAKSKGKVAMQVISFEKVTSTQNYKKKGNANIYGHWAVIKFKTEINS